MNGQGLREQLPLFRRWLIEQERSEVTVAKYMRDARRFTEFAGERPPDKALVMAYKTALGRDYAVAGANSMLAAVNAFLRFTGRGDLCVRLFKIQQQIYRAAEKELTREEYRRLVKTADAQGNRRLSLLMQTVCGTGIRIGELEYVTMEAVERGEATVSCKGKTRTVFIVAALRRKLQGYAREQGIAAGPIFITGSGKPMDRSNVWREMRSLCEQANVSPDKVFPHNLRHLFARTFYGEERDIVKLADVLGHSSINTTRLYVISTGAEHQRRMEQLRLIL